MWQAKNRDKFTLFLLWISKLTIKLNHKDVQEKGMNQSSYHLIATKLNINAGGHILISMKDIIHIKKMSVF